MSEPRIILLCQHLLLHVCGALMQLTPSLESHSTDNVTNEKEILITLLLANHFAAVALGQHSSTDCRIHVGNSSKNTIVYSITQASKIIMELQDPNQERSKLGRTFFQWVCIQSTCKQQKQSQKECKISQVLSISITKFDKPR